MSDIDTVANSPLEGASTTHEETATITPNPIQGEGVDGSVLTKLEVEPPRDNGTLLTEEAQALSDTKNVQGGLTIDTSNGNLDKLSTESLLEKRKALLWIATTGAVQSDSVFFFQGELGPIEMELQKRGIKLS